MCTITFIARKKGYCLGMNRDEKLTRPIALPPRLKKVDGRAVVCPSEPDGGTWIALNDSGATLALINWYSITDRVRTDPISRGKIVNTVNAATVPAGVESALDQILLKRINPFRLIGVFQATREVAEWRWDLKRLVRQNHKWKSQQWISSGFDEPATQRVRGKVFRQLQRQRSVGTLNWLHRLHRSHKPQAGPFSTCMHRADAATVSYTEIAVSEQSAVFCYHAGAPCDQSACSIHRLQFQT